MTRAMRLAILTSILAVAVRLIWIDQPYIDNWSWRQSDVAAISRNYFQGGFRFARPQIDWAGNESGYVGTEFPILPFLAAICYKIFGVHEWIGRVQALILFALSLPFFFLLVRKIFGEIAATWALFFYSFAPLGIMAGRCFMPDMPSLSLSIIGLYFFVRWIDRGGLKLFAASAALISLSVLIKATSIIIAAPLLYAAVAAVYDRRKIDFQKSDGHRPPLQSLALLATIALFPSAIWYWHAYQISQQFYPHHFFGAGGVKIMPLAWYWDIAKQIPTSEMTPVLFLLGAFGVWQARSARLRQGYGAAGIGALYAWLVAVIVFIVVVGFGNRHPWYRLPLVPVFAAFAGAACAFFAAKIPHRATRISLSILLIVLFGLPSFVYARQLYQSTAAPMRDAGLVLKKVAEPSALLVAADNGDPTIFYYAERKGWHFLEKNGIYNGEPIDGAQAIVDLEALRKRGASFVVFTSNTSWWLDYYEIFGQYVEGTSTLVEATSEFKIYKLNPVSK